MWLSVVEENIIYKDFTQKVHFLKEILGSVLFSVMVTNAKMIETPYYGRWTLIFTMIVNVYYWNVGVSVSAKHDADAVPTSDSALKYNTSHFAVQERAPLSLFLFHDFIIFCIQKKSVML